MFLIWVKQIRTLKKLVIELHLVKVDVNVIYPIIPCKARLNSLNFDGLFLDGGYSMTQAGKRLPKANMYIYTKIIKSFTVP